MKWTTSGFARCASRAAILAVGVALAAAMASPAIAAAVGSAARSPGWGRANGVHCRAYNLPVALAAGQPARYSLWGELCATRRELSGGTTAQLLIPGATYNHRYWDFGTVDGIRYSYARDVAAAGFPTFDIDQIGTGHSSHPLSTLVTNQVDAYTIHQAVQALLAGLPGGVQFAKVIEVGHSMGSNLAWLEAGTYHDVAGVIITGSTHFPGGLLPALEHDIHPAIDDPEFAHSGLDTGYITTIPGVRGKYFYTPSDSNPAVIAADEASKDVVSLTALAGVLGEITSDISAQITVPVVVIMGASDALNCGPISSTQTLNCGSPAAIVQNEGPLYSPHADLHACSVPLSGHDINLALNHRLEERDAIAWSREYVGQRDPGHDGADQSRTRHHPGERLPANCT